MRRDLAKRSLRRIFPDARLMHDYFRLVIRAADRRRPIFESIAQDLAKIPLA